MPNDERGVFSRRQLLRRVAGLGLGLAGVSVLAACGQGGGGGAPGGGPSGGATAQAPAATQGATVTIWTWRTQDQEVWQKAQDALQKTVSGLKLEVSPSQATQYDARVNTAMQGGQGPDIITTRAGASYFKPFADAQMFVPLTNVVPGLKDIPKATLNQLTYQNDVYAVPFAKQVSYWYYNIDTFQKHNLSVPKTWQELVQTLEALKSAGETVHFTPAREGWALGLYVDSVGGTFLGDDWCGQLIRGEKTFTDPKFVQLMTRLKDLQPFFQKDYTGNNVNDMTQAFQTGSAATILHGGWVGKTFGDGNPNLKWDVFLTPPDEAGGKQYSYVFLDGGYAVNNASKVKDVALEVVKFAATKDYGQIFTDSTAEMSGIPGVQAPTTNQHLQKELDLASEKYQLTNLFRIRSVLNDGNPGVYTLMNPLLEGLWANQVTPEDFSKQVQAGVAQWYPPFQGKS